MGFEGNGRPKGLWVKIGVLGEMAVQRDFWVRNGVLGGNEHEKALLD